MDDLSRACAFYAALGLERRLADTDGVAIFMAGPVVLSLYPRGSLAGDMGRPAAPAGAPSAITLACNVTSADAVTALLDRAQAAGGRRLRPATAMPWGGVVGYFADPDGHVWEAAFNPAFPFDGSGRLVVPDHGPPG